MIAYKKNGGQATQALGRSRGGLSTKIHAGCRDERTGVAVVLTAGHCHESPVFETVLAQVPPEPPLTHAMMDKGYDSDGIREHLIAHDIAPVIPSKSHRRAPLDYDKERYKLREKVKRFCNNLKQLSLSRFVAGAHAGAARGEPGAPPASATDRPCL